MMGAESVAYHRDTVIGRGDDHPGAALSYYASRGETPLAWGGSGASSLGLSGAVEGLSYDAIYGSNTSVEAPGVDRWRRNALLFRGLAPNRRRCE